jgi:hypothetical protein
LEIAASALWVLSTKIAAMLLDAAIVWFPHFVEDWSLQQLGETFDL